MEELKNILRNNRMSTRPEYYSGRGATLTDLDSKILEGIYEGIKTAYGDKAAKNFVKMVSGIKVLSATTFLNELYSLCYNDWVYKKKKSDLPGVEVPKDNNGNYDVQLGMFGMLQALSNTHDDTQAIKGYFCMRHGVKPKAGSIEMDEWGNVRRYY